MSDSRNPHALDASVHSLVQKTAEATQTLGLDLSTVKKQMLVDYLLELQKWNKTYNLTAVRGLDNMLVQHIFDCLAILPQLESYEAQKSARWADVIDVGSGAGLPGVVIAIARPQISVTCIDAVHKKHAFVSQVANKLGLKNLQSLHARVEKVSNLKADLVISRAFSSLSSFVDLCDHLVRPGGNLAAMKSKQINEEIQVFEQEHTAFLIDKLDELNVPQLDAKRFLVWVRRKSHE